MKIIADEKIPFLRGVFEPYAEVKYIAGNAISNEDLIDCDCLITRTRTICNESLLANSKVKFIATATIGMDHMDLDYLKKANISYSNAIGCNANSVAQYITSGLLNLAKNYNIDLKGKTLGIIGVGNVGKLVAKVGENLGMKLLLNDPPRAEIEGSENFIELAELLKKSDFITMHTPLNPTSYHLADSNFFETCKDGVFFINSGRGEVCDNKALLNAIKSGKVAASILDVWENEPNINLELLELVDFGTMHVAGYSANGKANGTTLAVRSVANYFNIDELKSFEVPKLKLCDNHLINLQEQNALYAINESYNIKMDSDNLKNSPEKFEFLRNNYHYRLEFDYFQIQNSCNLKSDEKEMLINLGFKE